ncbi:MAG: SUMF1/EgtB/PvdO family nonheme iron enzyme [Acidobacteriaceae bacterium]
MQAGRLHRAPEARRSNDTPGVQNATADAPRESGVGSNAVMAQWIAGWRVKMSNMAFQEITSTQAPPDMLWIPGGTFLMGSDDFYPEEAPVHEVSVDGFWMDRHIVTNEQFARFVEATGYVTVAERPLNAADYPGAPPENLVPGALTFQKTGGPVDLTDYRNWWAWTPGTSWRHPLGPESSIAGIERHPVVHVAYEDAEAYARWAGKELPTEAEWERAARGGLEGKKFTWGDEHFPGGKAMANSWQGEFPWQNLLLDGFAGTSPVGSFPPNDYGLFDMAGNVWEWTSDWYVHNHANEIVQACCGPAVNPRIASSQKSYDPRQPDIRIPRRVVKGGSHLCAPNYCLRYRPAARQPQMIDTGMSHIGFRCISRTIEAPLQEEVFEEAHPEPTKQPSIHKLKTSIREVFRQFKIMRRALVHPQVPWHAKAVAGCAVLYVVSPIQIIPNFIPIIGQMDDVLVVTLGIKYLRRYVPQSVLDECESGSHKPCQCKRVLNPVPVPLPSADS